MTETTRPFMNPDSSPSIDQLQTVLGTTFALYQDFLQVTASFKQTWSFSKSSGWMLKIHDGKKALCYLIPLQGVFKVNLAIREEERTACMQDAALQHFHQTLAEARKVLEGYPLSFDVPDPTGYQHMLPIIRKIISMR